MMKPLEFINILVNNEKEKWFEIPYSLFKEVEGYIAWFKIYNFIETRNLDYCIKIKILEPQKICSMWDKMMQREFRYD